MFVDEPTLEDLLRDGSIPRPEARSVGLWRVVVVKNMPFADPRRNGKVPKLLLHRLFPRARYSLWVDAKLRLKRDPLQVRLSSSVGPRAPMSKRSDTMVTFSFWRFQSLSEVNGEGLYFLYTEYAGPEVLQPGPSFHLHTLSPMFAYFE